MKTNIHIRIRALACATLLSAAAMAQSDSPTLLVTLSSGESLEFTDFGEGNWIDFLPNDTLFLRPDHGDNLPELLAKDPSISLFYEALQLTGMLDSIADFMYTDYHCSEDSTKQKRVYKTAVEYDAVYFPEYLFKKYTVFAPQNEVFAAKGINNIADLRTYAAQVYDAVFPDDAKIYDPTDRRNSLNRFVSYHLLDRLGEYYMLTAEDGGVLHNNFDRDNLDIADWYETMMPHSVLKCSFPKGDEEGLYINRRGACNRPDYYGMFIRGAKVTSPTELTIDNHAVNGIYHYIDDLLLYDNTTQFSVLNERWRIDTSTLSPEFMTQGARGHKVRGIGGCPAFPGYYGVSSNSADPNTIPNLALAFKEGSLKNFQFSAETTSLHLRPRYLNFWSYQGDEIMLCGQFDLTVKLPPMPAGEWELRLGGPITVFDDAGTIQFYIDGQEAGKPLKMCIPKGDPSIGWVSDEDLTSKSRLEELGLFQYVEDIWPKAQCYEEVYHPEDDYVEYVPIPDKWEYLENVEAEDYEAVRYRFDQRMRTLGWMKGPSTYGSTQQDGSGNPIWLRGAETFLRRIIGTIQSDGKAEHTFRLQQLEPPISSRREHFLPFDYIELCPKSVYDNPNLREDIY